ncbi:MAG: UDP-2,3-diacylglucosamine diphosphatase [Prevotellaceae bacterium]|nr:UDP-2,3-diacylglucosamine diphosphatase [Prevotellaceae bacterium]
MKHYFVADVHLGLTKGDPTERERSFVLWLNSIDIKDAEVWLLGDIFDFWWEYKYVVPKGYIRTMGKMAQMVESGVKIHYFKGNHDRWSIDYLKNEVGVQIHDKAAEVQIGETRFFIGHGYGYGKRSKGLLNNMFDSHLLQRCFGAIHPRWGMSWGHRWSARSRRQSHEKNEFTALYSFAATYPQQIDYFIFGHLHTPIDTILPNKARFVVLGEWMQYGQYVVFDEERDHLEIKSLSL